MKPDQTLHELFAFAKDLKDVEGTILKNFSGEAARSIMYHIAEALQCCDSDPARAGAHVQAVDRICKLERVVLSVGRPN